eukprot:Seg4404.3 transcript_id=Seg4404.3/GoldUCD/mRNA.D3Y31 product="Monocarboxylate transporter 10" protein_id=Seg4404.3/GoldUCD/D3Y31
MAFLRCVFKRTVKSRDSAFAIVIVAASTLISLCTYGFLYNFGLFYNTFLVKFQDSKEKTAWMISIPMSLSFLLAPIASWCINKYGLRRCATAAAFPLGGSLFLTSFARNLDETFLTFSIPFGIIAAVFVMALNKAPCVYFDKWYAAATGFMVGAVSISQVGMSYLQISLLDNFGLKQTLQVFAALFFVVCLISSQAFCPTSYSVEEKKEESPKGKGFRIYLDLLKHKPMALFLFVNFVVAFAYTASTVHQVQFAVEFGIPKKISKQFPVFSAVANGLGRIFVGLILDSVLRKQNKVTCYKMIILLTGSTAFIGSFANNQTQLIVYIWVYSFFDGAMQTACYPALREIIGFEHLSEAASLVLVASGASSMLGPPLIGFIVDKTQDYTAFFYVAGTPPILAFILLNLLYFIKKDTFKPNDSLQIKERIDDENEATEPCIDDNNEKALLRLETPV